MSTSSVVSNLQGAVLTITLNRPDVLNSFNRAMSLELKAAFERAHQDKDVRAVLLTGAGRAFCAGQDLSDVGPSPDGSLPDLGQIVIECYNPIISLIRNIEKPVVCAVNGVAAGAGANLAFACDIVVASAQASFIQSFSKVGLIPDSGGTFLLPRLVGMARATALTFLADKLSATEAQNMGLVYKIFEPNELLPGAQTMCSQLASQPTRGFGLTKRAFNLSWSNNLETQLALEAKLQREAGNTQDYREGVTSFMAKKTPQFRGV